MDKDKLFDEWVEEFYDKYIVDQRIAMEDFQSIAVGFFIAKGLTLDEAYEMYEYCKKRNKF